VKPSGHGRRAESITLNHDVSRETFQGQVAPAATPGAAHGRTRRLVFSVRGVQSQLARISFSLITSGNRRRRLCPRRVKPARNDFARGANAERHNRMIAAQSRCCAASSCRDVVEHVAAHAVATADQMNVHWARTQGRAPVAPFALPACVRALLRRNDHHAERILALALCHNSPIIAQYHVDHATLVGSHWPEAHRRVLAGRPVR
jgi:hypothetical protein